MKRIILTAPLLLSLFLSGGCQKTYYKTMETFGYHKRDILVERVEESRDAQEQAKEQFKSALEKFSEVVTYDGGELEKKYNQLKSELDKSEAKAGKVRDRIDAVQDVAEALFSEWEKELDQYTNERYRETDEQLLTQTKQSYAKLMGAMKKAEARMEPVLTAFRDQVLFLKHHLNARAVASLQDELVVIESDVASLVAEMEASIAEADAFINDMKE
ncbi:MAG: DUF2959 domain-containing protein [Phycisphaerae bacterium]